MRLCRCSPQQILPLGSLYLVHFSFVSSSFVCIESALVSYRVAVVFYESFLSNRLLHPVFTFRSIFHRVIVARLYRIDVRWQRVDSRFLCIFFIVFIFSESFCFQRVFREFSSSFHRVFREIWFSFSHLISTKRLFPTVSTKLLVL